WRHLVQFFGEKMKPSRASISAVTSILVKRFVIFSVALTLLLLSATATSAQVTLTSISVSPSSPSIPVRLTQQFTATGHLSDGSSRDLTQLVTWKSSSTTVATVSNTSGTQGLATAKAPGATTISATVVGVTGSATLTVNGATVTSMVLQPLNPSLAASYRMQFASTGNYSNGTSFDITAITAWSSSNTAIATISNATGTKGLATALTAGTTKITATIAGATPVSTNLTVKSVTLTSVSISPGNPTVPLGTTQQFAATGTFSDGSTADISGSVVWKSSNTPVASISSSGLASTAAAGTTTITASSSGKSNSTLLSVTPFLVSISVAPLSPSIPLGRNQQFTATGHYSDGSTQVLTNLATWSSSNTSAATISNSSGTQGFATSKTIGSTNISAAYAGTVSSPDTLAVTSPVLVSIAVSPTGPSIPKGRTQQFAATGTYTDGSTQNLTST